MHWFADFLYLYAFGMSGAVAFVPEKSIGRYFFKFHAILALVLIVVATLIGRPLLAASKSPMGTVAGIAAIAFGITVLLVVATSVSVRAPLRVELLWMPISTGVLFTVFEGIAVLGLPMGLLLALHLITCAAMLGSSLIAMSLGHWYLNDASLSFDHLVGLTRWFVIACGAKLVVSGVYFALGFKEFWRVAFEFEGIYLWTRLLAGGAFSLVLALMAYACAKQKSNQSATGILYVAVMFVLVGEVMSLYLTLGKGTPL